MRTILLLVHGLPATGKTTLAQWLSRELGWPAIHKDAIKEILFDTLGAKDRAWSRNLGIGAIEILYHVIDMQLSVGISCIAECPFKPTLASPRLRASLTRADASCVQLLCRSSGAVRLERFQGRRRHPGHADDEVTDAAVDAWCNETLDPLDLPGPLIEVDTTDRMQVDYKAILSQILAYRSIA